MASIIWLRNKNQLALKPIIAEAETRKENGFLPMSVNDYLFRHGDEYHIAKGNSIENITAVA